ncbi:hypothetical protein S245_048508, partial [Arachis hypogaea]
RDPQAHLCCWDDPSLVVLLCLIMLLHDAQILIQMYRTVKTTNRAAASSGEGGLMNVDHEDIMLIMPPLFAPKHLPENLVLVSLTFINVFLYDIFLVFRIWQSWLCCTHSSYFTQFFQRK